MCNLPIKLVNGKWYAEVSPEHGANLTTLMYDGQAVLRQRPANEEEMDDPYVYGAPLLLPSNRTVQGSFTFEGKTYHLPINEGRSGCQLHGVIHNQPFKVVNTSDNSVIMEFVNDGELYPFKFKISVQYEIDYDGVWSRYTIENLDDKNMPYTFGLHTTFQDPDYFSLPLSEIQESGEYGVPTGRFLPLNEVAKQYQEGMDPRGKSVSGFYKSGGHTARIGKNIQYEVSEQFDYWILYNAFGKKDFLCVEPQAGGVNGLNIPNEHRILGPKQKEILWTRIIFDENEKIYS